MESISGTEKPRRRSWRFWLFVLSPFLLLGTCSIFVVKSFRAVQPAEKEAAMFHERLEAGQYDAIFAAAAPAFQKSVQHEAFTQYLATIHDKMGSCSPPSKADNYFANSNQSGTTVQMRYHVECSKGRLDEGMTFLMKNGAAKLLQYDASSPFLMR